MSLVSKVNRRNKLTLRPPVFENAGREERGENTSQMDWILNNTSQLILRSRNRRSLTISNNSGNIIYISIDTPARIGHGKRLGGGTEWEPRLPPNGAIHIVGTSGGEEISTIEEW